VIEPLAVDQPSQPRAIVRTALVERLLRRDEAVVALIAPAGYGKTMLLEQWAKRDARPSVWCTLTATHDEPGALETALAALAAPGRLVIVDDVQHIRSAAGISTLRRLLRALPAGTMAALAGRAEPQGLLPRLRAEGRVFELGPDLLAFTTLEARALLRREGVLLPDRGVAELAERAEGWPAVLYLAALALRAGVEPSTFGGDDRFVADYLETEHLAALTPAQRRFVTGTCMLDLLTAEAADAFAPGTDFSRMIAVLERHGVVVALDHRRARYRYRRPVREVLRGALERSDPRGVRELHRAAAAWSVTHGAADEAIRHALAADDQALVAQLAGDVVPAAVARGRFADAERLLDRLGDDGADVDVGVAASLLHALRGRADASRAWADRTMRSTGQDDPRVSLLRAMHCADGVEAMRADADAAWSSLPADSTWLLQAAIARAAACLTTGDDARAETYLADAAEDAGAAGATHLRVLALSLRAVAAPADAAAGLVAEAHADLSDEPSLTTLLFRAVSARAALHAGDRDRAAMTADQADELLELVTPAVPWLSAFALLELAQVRVGLGDPERGRVLLRRLGDVLCVRPLLGAISDRAAEVDRRVQALAAPEGRWASSLTRAELRLLPLLATHLSFREIGQHLYVSQNTVKTQAISIYRKFGVSSRSEAIARAIELGLVDSRPLHPMRGMPAAEPREILGV
jgi:LuxR family transcriptional regulator, maltose regulon positive regulatory protein